MSAKCPGCGHSLVNLDGRELCYCCQKIEICPVCGSSSYLIINGCHGEERHCLACDFVTVNEVHRSS
jgi:hypothetical protein